MLAKLLHPCFTFGEPMNRSSPSPSVPGILQARMLEWVAMLSCRESSRPRDQTHVSYASCVGRQVLYHWSHLGSLGTLMKVKVIQLCLTLCDPHGLYSPWNTPCQNTGVGSCSLLQGIFPIQESNSGSLNCRWIIYQLSYQRSFL